MLPSDNIQKLADFVSFWGYLGLARRGGMSQSDLGPNSGLHCFKREVMTRAVCRLRTLISSLKTI